MKQNNIKKYKEQAIEAVLEGDFATALNLLTNVLNEAPEDIEALMQFAHIYWQNGDYEKAKTIYLKVKKLDPNNMLAQKKLSTISSLMQKKTSSRKRKIGKIMPITRLIEEPGKAKIIRLSTLGKQEDLSGLNVGEEIFLNIRKRKIEVRDINNRFIGYLPDDISKRLIEFINQKTKYEAYIFAVDKNECRIYVRESKKPSRLSQISSFPIDGAETAIPPLPEEMEEDENKRVKLEDKELDLDSEETIIPTTDLSESDDEENDKDEDVDDDYREYEE